MNIKRIAGHDLVPGRIIKGHIHVGGTEIHVPHVIISGHKPGPMMLSSREKSLGPYGIILVK